jgi:signal transduction histidine kinase/DNA-binding response OmpR family regulator
MNSLKKYILSQSKKQTKIIVSIFFILISIGWFTAIWSIYIKSSNNVISSLIHGISNSILLGDSFAIENVLSSLIQTNTFNQIIIRSNSRYTQNEEIKINNLGIQIIDDENSIVFNDLILYNDKKLYYYQRLKIYSKNKKHLGFLYFVKKIDLIIIITIYLILLLISFLIYLFTKKKVTLIYNKILEPLFEIEKYIKQDKLQKKIKLEFDEFDNLYQKIVSYQEGIKKSQQDQLKIAELSAITSTIQMLAHDIRQPFSRLKMSLDIMKKSKSHEEILNLIQTIGTNTNLDILQIEYFLNDIIQSRNNDDIKLEEESLLKILSSVLKTCFEIQNNLDISFEYHFFHKHKIIVDIKKIERVFSNIILNAIQAMANKKGKIWLNTKEYFENEIAYIEVCIGNNNSYIEQDDLEKIFDLFFTKGKRKGTGLGLAISSQIIKNHGGKITCRSCRERGVEFFFSFPLNSSNVEFDIQDFKFPEHCKFYEIQFQIHHNKIQSYYEKESLLLENKIFNEIQTIEKKNYTILILEDDVNYLQSFLSILNDYKKIHPFFKMITASNFESGVHAFKMHEPDFLICDIDLNQYDKNGFDFVKEIRKFNQKVKICIHTNRFIKEDLLFSADIKSDLFVIKPMTSFHLLNFIGSLFSLTSNGNHPDLIKLENIVEDVKDELILDENRGTVIIVDDDEFYLSLWKEIMKDSTIKIFNHPSLAHDFLTKNPEYLEKTECMILDYYLENKVNIIESGFINNIRKIGFKHPIFVCSNAILDKNDISLFDGVLEKQPCNLSKIKEIFKDKF